MGQVQLQRRIYLSGNEYYGQLNTAGEFHGCGIYKWADGDIYFGFWRNNTRTGKGVHRYKNGTIYHGKFLNGEKHGYGSWKTVDGHRYSGNWQFDKREGQGTYTWPNGDKYVGIWMNGEPTVEGTFTPSIRKTHKKNSFGDFVHSSRIIHHIDIRKTKQYEIKHQNEKHS